MLHNVPHSNTTASPCAFQYPARTKLFQYMHIMKHGQSCRNISEKMKKGVRPLQRRTINTLVSRMLHPILSLFIVEDTSIYSHSEKFDELGASFLSYKFYPQVPFQN